MNTTDWDGVPFDRTPGTCVVDDRIMVLGLDALYRDSMQEVEMGRYLESARALAKRLRVSPANVPVEGYYAESKRLREYFQLMRALQEKDEAAERLVKDSPEFQALWDLTNSGMYGCPERKGKLLPQGRDPVSIVLRAASEWTLAGLVDAAHRLATEEDDWSLVGLAARTADPAVITATRESVVLYAVSETLGLVEVPEYRFEWEVDEGLAAAANRLVETANRFVVTPLPRVEPENAAVFYRAFTNAELLGRCVRLGQSADGARYYHWAIRALGGTGEVEEFWSSEIWTTTRYRAERLRVS